jgi:hypothetical protein
LQQKFGCKKFLISKYPPLPAMPASDQERQPFSFGDFTLPCGNPPLVNNFGNNLWNQCYSWSDYTSYDYCNSYNNGIIVIFT